MLLPYVARRPLTLRTFPQGIDGPGIYMKRVPKGAPAWIETFRDQPEPMRAGQPKAAGRLRHRQRAGGRPHPRLDGPVQRVEVHPWLSRVDQPRPPGLGGARPRPARRRPARPRTPSPAWPRAARRLRERLAARGLDVPTPSSPGRAGIHLLLPLEPVHAFDDVRAFLVAEAQRGRAPTTPTC